MIYTGPVSTVNNSTLWYIATLDLRGQVAVWTQPLTSARGGCSCGYRGRGAFRKGAHVGDDRAGSGDDEMAAATMSHRPAQGLRAERGP